MNSNEIPLFWKSSYCTDGPCVEVAESNGIVFVRDSKINSIKLLEFTRPAWKTFVESVQKNDFDM